MAHWARPPQDRYQVSVFAPTLDDMIPADHPVRYIHELIEQIDFAAWESQYVRFVGQPPIHPRVMAAALLYGYSRGIRSSRQLEEAALNRLDFMWLLNGHRPDHSTFASFRVRFGPELKDLFRDMTKLGITVGLVKVTTVAIDGSTFEADSSRHGTVRRPALEKKLAEAQAEFEQAMQEAEQLDRKDDGLYGRDESPAKLPPELGDAKRRKEKLEAGMASLEQMEAARAKRGEKTKTTPAVPLADPESRVLPGKKGGYAPAYTGVATTDVESGMILDAQVISGNDEASTVMPAVKNIQENYQQTPEGFLGDSGFNTGENLAGLDEEGITPLMPPRQLARGDNVALREDPTQPVDPSLHDRLPMNPQNKILDKSAFIYDEAADVYRCPMGQTLPVVENKGYNHRGKKGRYTIYECGSCAGCPLGPKCLPKKAEARRVCRDEFEDLREEMEARRRSPEGKASYARRAPVSEHVFAIFRTVMNFRRFLVRGLDKVNQEFLWVASAFNMMKLIRRMMSQRDGPPCGGGAMATQAALREVLVETCAKIAA